MLQLMLALVLVVLLSTGFLFLYQVKFVDPLLRSPIVNDVAYETLIKLSRCLAPPLCNSALDIATALRMIVTDGDHLLLDLIPLVGEAETNGRPSLGILERIVTALSVACKYGSLPIDTFTFIFPVWILLVIELSHSTMTRLYKCSFLLLYFRSWRKFYYPPRRQDSMTIFFVFFTCTWIPYYLFLGCGCYQ